MTLSAISFVTTLGVIGPYHHIWREHGVGEAWQLCGELL